MQNENPPTAVTTSATTSIEVVDPPVKVRTMDQPDTWSVWHMVQNLTDSWGDINPFDAENKPLADLQADPERFSRLLGQMRDEITFIVRKDGKFGILFEVEFCSAESEKEEAESGGGEWYASLKPHAEVIKSLLTELKVIAPYYPGVEFAVPEEKEIVNERPAAWAFVTDGLLSGKQLDSLSQHMSLLLSSNRPPLIDASRADSEERMSARLTLDVTYLLNGMSADDMIARLTRMVERSIGEGFLTGDTPAEVDSFTTDVRVISEDLDDDAVTDYLLEQIESGNMSLEDIPSRMSRYGFMEKYDFIDEMQERMSQA